MGEERKGRGEEREGSGIGEERKGRGEGLTPGQNAITSPARPASESASESAHTTAAGRRLPMRLTIN